MAFVLEVEGHLPYPPRDDRDRHPDLDAEPEEGRRGPNSRRLRADTLRQAPAKKILLA
jgi:hypothetical protein